MPHHAVYVAPVESIQEVNISTNNFDAEQGMTGGAAVTVITKSGTNDLRGSLLRDARQQRAARVHVGRESRRRHRQARGPPQHRRRQPRRAHQKNKLFFFANWEGTFERVSRSVLYSVPTADFRAGDFSRMLGAPILSAGGSPIMVPHHRGRLGARFAKA